MKSHVYVTKSGTAINLLGLVCVNAPVYTPEYRVGMDKNSDPVRESYKVVLIYSSGFNLPIYFHDKDDAYNFVGYAIEYMN